MAVGKGSILPTPQLASGAWITLDTSSSSPRLLTVKAFARLLGVRLPGDQNDCVHFCVTQKAISPCSWSWAPDAPKTVKGGGVGN